MADSLVDHLVKHKFPALSFHGGSTRNGHEMALDTSRAGNMPVLEATAVVSRGPDIPNVTHLVSYDLSSDIDNSVHRIGRTGHVRDTSLATVFFNQCNRSIARDLATHSNTQSRRC